MASIPLVLTWSIKDFSSVYDAYNGYLHNDEQHTEAGVSTIDNKTKRDIFCRLNSSVVAQSMGIHSRIKAYSTTLKLLLSLTRIAVPPNIAYKPSCGWLRNILYEAKLLTVLSGSSTCVIFAFRISVIEELLQATYPPPLQLIVTPW